MTDQDNNPDEAQDELRQRFSQHSQRREREPSDDESGVDTADESVVEKEQASTIVEPEQEPEREAEPDIPYILERSTVKEGRDQVRQFFLREEIAAGERDLRNAVEDELGTDVKKLDLREAAYVVAQRHPEEVANVLREWGYEYR